VALTEGAIVEDRRPVELVAGTVGRFCRSEDEKRPNPVMRTR